MSFTVTSQEEGIVRLEDADGPRLGIASGLNPKVFRSANLTELQKECGWIFDFEGRAEAWHIDGVTEDRGQMIFHGPWLKGRLFNPEELSVEMLELLTTVFRILVERKMSVEGFFTRSWFFTEDSRVLLMPSALMDFIRRGQTEQIRQNCWNPYNHPDRSGEEGFSFTLGVLSYQLLSGMLPFGSPDEESLYEEMRKQPAVPPEVRIPGLKEEISRIISAALNGGETVPSLGEWEKVLPVWEKEGAVRELSEEELEEHRQKTQHMEARREKHIHRRLFWRKKRTLIAATTAAVVLLLIFISNPVRKALEPPVTMGMTPQEVVESYYSCFETLDQDLMDDCIDKKAGKSDVTEVMNIFVTSRVRQGYEGKSGILSAREWSEQGRPMPEPGTSVYGLTDLVITPRGDSRFLAEYEKWIPGTPPDDGDPSSIQPLYPAGLYVTDLVVLEQQDKGNWLIVSLEREVEEIKIP